ncbi:hypothetical protein SAMN02910289_00190 [Lachnospiraceae bacterium RM5]|nr:hypothetical protein SAMN02910289_00190 [Lachnospiraceae bacterium RM5]
MVVNNTKTIDVFMEIKKNTDDLIDVKRFLENHESDLSEAWVGLDEKILESKINDLSAELKSIIGDLEDIGYDILNIGNCEE